MDNISVAAFTNPTTFVGVVAMPGENIGRINLFATSVGAAMDSTQLFTGADNIGVYVPEPSSFLLVGLLGMGLTTCWSWKVWSGQRKSSMTLGK
jgi:hypothetical protein